MPEGRCCWITGWATRDNCVRWISSASWWRLRSSCHAGSDGGCARLGGIFRALALLVAFLTSNACHRGTPEETSLLLGHCTTRVRTKGPVPRLPPAPALRPGFGAVVGTLADSGGALPHYPILASIPGGAANSPHATATADSVGGFVFIALPPGHYRLHVRAFAHRPDSTDIVVAAGRVDTVRIVTRLFECVR